MIDILNPGAADLQRRICGICSGVRFCFHILAALPETLASIEVFSGTDRLIQNYSLADSCKGISVPICLFHRRFLGFANCPGRGLREVFDRRDNESLVDF